MVISLRFDGHIFLGLEASLLHDCHGSLLIFISTIFNCNQCAFYFRSHTITNRDYFTLTWNISQLCLYIAKQERNTESSSVKCLVLRFATISSPIGLTLPRPLVFFMSISFLIFSLLLAKSRLHVNKWRWMEGTVLTYLSVVTPQSYPHSST